MPCANCLYNSGLALRRVFLEPAPTSQVNRLLLPSLTTTTTHQRRLFGGIRRINNQDKEEGYEPLQTERQNNNFRNHTSPTLNPNPRTHTRGAPTSSPSPPASLPYGRLPRDAEIKSDYVLLRQEDGRLSPPQPLQSVLFETSVRNQTLVTLALPGSGGSKYPICVALDRASYEEAEREKNRQEKDKAKEERKRAKGTKELEINWATAPHDLEIKMKRLREFLGKGLRVEVKLLSKKSRKTGKREATKEEATEILRAVRRTALEEVVGTKEWKPSDGSVGKSYKMFLEGPQGPQGPQGKKGAKVKDDDGVAGGEVAAAEA